MASLEDKFTDALDIGASMEDELEAGRGWIDSVLSQMGRNASRQNAEMAAALAGTTDKNSKAYKAQLRNVQRWRKGRTPSRRSRRQVGKVAPRRANPRIDRMRRRGASVTIRGQFDVKTGARGKKRQDRHAQKVRSVTVALSGAELEPALDAWERRDDGTAASSLVDAFDTYFAGQGNLEIHNVISMKIDPR